MDSYPLVVSFEGVWGSGKTTLTKQVHSRLMQLGLEVLSLHYGPRNSMAAPLSEFLNEHPLRSRQGAGGFASNYHAKVDVMLRMAQEAYDHSSTYRVAMCDCDVLLLDSGIHTVMSYSLTILKECFPEVEFEEHYRSLQAATSIWAVQPELVFFLDTPWPIARVQASSRGAPRSLERLLFLPKWVEAWEAIISTETGIMHRLRPRYPDMDAAAEVAESIIRERLENLPVLSVK